MKVHYFLAALLLLVCADLYAQLPQAYIDRLQFVFDSTCTARNIKGASAAVVVPGMGIWEGVHGVSHAGAPIEPSMFLGLGSNTKTYVATAMLKLQEQGLLDLDDAVGTWITHPNIDPAITIRQLLNHSSGLYNFTSSAAWNNAVNSDFGQIWEPEDILQYIEAPVFTPGSSWGYSNTNYLLAGLIIEAVTNDPLHDVLSNLVLTPAGLDSTVLYVEGTDDLSIPHIWTIHTASNSPLVDLTATFNYQHNSVMTAAWAAGGILSTAKDNAMFWSKLMEGEMISPASWSEMSTTLPIGSITSYGLGIFKRTNFNGQTVWSHGGTNLGFINENVGDPLTGVGISVLTNQDSVSNNIILNNVVRMLHSVTMDPSIGIAEVGTGSFSIYPNPAADVFRIDCPMNRPVHLKIHDLSGRTAMEVPAFIAGDAINVASLPTGSYVVEMLDGSTRSIGRLSVGR